MLQLLAVVNFFKSPSGLIQKIVIGSSIVLLVFSFGLYEGRKYTILAEGAKYEAARKEEQKYQNQIEDMFRKREEELITKQQELERTINENNAAADRSSTAGTTCLPIDSVHRLNKIR